MILAVTGLGREARLISRPNIAIAIGAGDSQALRARIENALDAGARRIISMGICGALSASLKVGDCVVPTEIVTEHERLPTHGHWSSELLAQVPDAKPAILAGADVIVANGASKKLLHQTTGAAAVDMESHIAARIAQARGLPFAAFRVVSDSFEQSLPPAALIATSAAGEVDVFGVLRSLVTKPSQIPALMRTAWEAEKAFRVLLRCRSLLGPRLAFPDLGELVLDVA